MLRIINTLTGRFLILTVIFVMLAEVLIFVPSVARFRLTYLQERLERSQIASLSLLAAPDDMVSEELRDELLYNAEVQSIVLRRDRLRELVLVAQDARMVDATYDLRDPGTAELIVDALMLLARPTDRVIRVIGMPVKGGGMEIEATLREAPLRDAMIYYGLNILWLSLVISVITAALLFLSVRGLIVKPIRRVVGAMMHYAEDPEDQSRIITPTNRVSELLAAERALHDLQTQLTRALRQKERLAALGGAISRISHDLRNMLTTAQLLADRFERSADPAVRRTAPKLVGSINRAIALCERTLTFGKAEEPPPTIRMQPLAAIVNDVLESERLRAEDDRVTLTSEVDPGLEVPVDPEQIYRVLTNLVRNARQAIVGAGRAGEIRISAAEEGGTVAIEVADTGPGLPPKARENLFRPFRGGTRRGGSGLGLAIAAELLRGHGGSVDLKKTSEAGTTFIIRLPAKLAKAG